jgi:hypothetical protein
MTPKSFPVSTGFARLKRRVWLSAETTSGAVVMVKVPGVLVTEFAGTPFTVMVIGYEPTGLADVAVVE